MVLYLGNTGVGHGFGTVLDAAARLADEALFLFVGGGARWADLEREVAAGGLDQRRAARLRAQGRHAGGDGRRRPRPDHARRPQPRA